VTTGCARGAGAGCAGGACGEADAIGLAELVGELDGLLLVRGGTAACYATREVGEQVLVGADAFDVEGPAASEGTSNACLSALGQVG